MKPFPRKSLGVKINPNTCRNDPRREEHPITRSVTSTSRRGEYDLDC